jgi:uncharacterized membrane protein
MWSINELKQRAWSILTKNYWWALLAVFLTTLIQTTATSIVYIVSSIIMPAATSGLSLLMALGDGSHSTASLLSQYIAIISATGFLQLLVSAISVAVIMFLSAPLNYGLTNYFMNQRNHEKYTSVDMIFSAFQKGSYKRVTSGMAWGYLWQYIWSFVSTAIFIVPTVSLIFGTAAIAHFADSSDEAGGVTGILIFVVFMLIYFISLAVYLMIVINRMYAYLYIPFILVDQPQLSYREVMNMSKKMTDGQKGRMFILDLSFIGWWLLTMLSCGLLSVALIPYIYTTRVELYHARKAEMDAQTSIC